ncbi:unnamed protein product [Rotaria sordida]|uniref:Uncharacterized protein n=1 Tax=Rotaria sordida TaxID=392033 RepID=A0A815T6Z4_9BILA|nr:unnamed protein product [Rotaria sordida]CAF4182911.1 unnamed protein product [Rotaria sordida]
MLYYFKQLKHKRENELDSEPLTMEVKCQLSDTIDLLESYDSIRYRSRNFSPSPSIQITSTDKVNETY